MPLAHHGPAPKGKAEKNDQQASAAKVEKAMKEELDAAGKEPARDQATGQADPRS
jgi:hypothetical protein